MVGSYKSSIPCSSFTMFNTEVYCIALPLALDSGALDQDIDMLAMLLLDTLRADNTSWVESQAKNPLAAFRDLSELMASIFTAPKITSMPDLPG